MELRVPEEADRDFVAGAFVVRGEKVLLLNHKKYGIWLQPGGHIEEKETPDEAAVRETREETGLEVEIVGNEDVIREDRVDLPQPLNINLHRIEDGHWHCDFLYLAKIKSRIDDQEYDSSDINWFSKEELDDGRYDLPETTRKWGKKAIEKAI